MYPVVVRAEVVREIGAGESAERVAARVGVNASGAGRWVKLAGMSLRAGRRGGVGSARRITVFDAMVTPGGRVTLSGRSWIETRLRQGWSQASIARDLGVHRSTVSREVRRGASAAGAYRALRAHGRAVSAAARPKPRKLDEPALRSRVLAGLLERCSPVQIAGRLQRECPGREELQVSHETIYQALYVQGAGSLRHELGREKALRSGRTTRLPRSRLPARGARSWIGNDAHITDRPAQAADRALPGHWEGDLVLGAPGRGALISLFERSSRYALLGLLPGTHDARTVTDTLIEMVSTLPAALRGSLTWDCGSEMARHAELTLATDLRVFFCDPHSPWQRPGNENLNGLIREFFPKGTDFTATTPAEVAEAQRLLNIRPRKILDFATPAETLSEQLNVAMTP